MKELYLVKNAHHQAGVILVLVEGLQCRLYASHLRHQPTGPSRVGVGLDTSCEFSPYAYSFLSLEVGQHLPLIISP